MASERCSVNEGDGGVNFVECVSFWTARFVVEMSFRADGMDRQAFTDDAARAPRSELGLPVSSAGYHQGAETLPRMIATTTLPWSDGMKLH
jgi:hypothetical protein